MVKGQSEAAQRRAEVVAAAKDRGRKKMQQRQQQQQGNTSAICSFDLSNCEPAQLLPELDMAKVEAMVAAATHATRPEEVAESCAAYFTGFIINNVDEQLCKKLEEDDAVVPRSKFLIPTFDAPVAAAQGKESASRRRGQVFMQSQTVSDFFASFFPKAGFAHCLIAPGKLMGIGIKEDMAKRCSSSAVWAQRAEPEGRYVGTEYGEVGSMRLTFSGLRKVGVVNTAKLCEFLQTSDELKAKAAMYDSLIKFLETCSQDMVADLSRRGIVQWAQAGPRSVMLVPQGSLIVDCTVGTKTAIGIKQGILMQGVGKESMAKLQQLYKANGRPNCAAHCGGALVAIETLQG